jgi:hypothetical protein
MTPKVLRSGRIVDLETIAPEDVALEDVVAGLTIQRFGSQTFPRSYTVAEHLVLMHDYVLNTFDDRKLALAALAHDLAEAYVGDIHGPLKKRLPSFRPYEVRAERAILAHLVAPHEDDRALVAGLDRRMLVTELAHFWPQHAWERMYQDRPLVGVIIQEWHPQDAARMLTNRLETYWHE